MELNTCFPFADKFSWLPAVQLEQMLPLPLPRYHTEEKAETLEGFFFLCNIKRDVEFFLSVNLC